MRPITTLQAWYNYDNTLFANLNVPAGADKDKLIASILDLSSEFGTIYSDPATVKYQIGLLTDRYSWGMERDWRVLTEEYDPLHNYDRREAYTDAENRHGSTSTQLTGDAASTGSSQSEATTTDKIMAYDSTDFTNAAQQTGDTAANDSTQTHSHSEGTTSVDDARTMHHDAHLYGNIGVMSSQQMLEQERAIAAANGWYETWANKFIAALCVCIY